MAVQQTELEGLVRFVRSIYGEEGFIPLHRPVFEGNERKYLVECIDSNFVSSVGEQIGQFEGGVARFTGANYAVAAVNGTAALHLCLIMAGVAAGDEVITQSLTFIATCNALSYSGAHPVFVDVDRHTLGMSPEALSAFLREYAVTKDGVTRNRLSGRRIAACVPMHTFGIPCEIADIVSVCDSYRIPVIEDAAESLGSYVGERHTGTFGLIAALSFNGNKVITTGGGGMLITNDETIAKRAKHLSTTAKVPHAYEFVHDEVGYNYRMPNLNAVLGLAQLEQLPIMLKIKNEVADRYAEYFGSSELKFIRCPQGNRSNYWLNAVIMPSKADRDRLLEYSNGVGVMMRPIWRLMSDQAMFRDCQADNLANSSWLVERVVNLPSSVPDSELARLRAIVR